jgi:hypothetical protein
MIRVSDNCKPKIPVYTHHMSQEPIVAKITEPFTTQNHPNQSFLHAYSEIEDATMILPPQQTYTQLPNMKTFPQGIRATPYGFNQGKHLNADGLDCKEQYEQEFQRQNAWYNYLYDQAFHGPEPDRKNILFLKDQMKKASNCGKPVSQEVEYFDGISEHFGEVGYMEAAEAGMREPRSKQNKADQYARWRKIQFGY